MLADRFFGGTNLRLEWLHRKLPAILQFRDARIA
jgi:hypothetical protein